MRVISRRAFREFSAQNRRHDRDTAESELKAWFYEARNASWSGPAEVKEKYGSASILKNGRCVFNICGNNYRLIVQIDYGRRIIYIRWIGTHKEYDDINAEEV